MSWQILKPRVSAHRQLHGLRRRRGGTLVETALCGVILFAFTFGVIEAGWFFYCKNIMAGAAREGCRNGILQSAGSGITGTGSASSVNATIVSYLGRAGLIPGVSSASGSETYTIGNYTVTFWDYNYFNGTTTQVADPSSVSVGDGFEVKISATWSVIGAYFRGSSAGSQYINPTKDPGKIDTYCIMRKEAD